MRSVISVHPNHGMPEELPRTDPAYSVMFRTAAKNAGRFDFDRLNSRACVACPPAGTEAGETPTESKYAR